MIAERRSSSVPRRSSSHQPQQPQHPQQLPRQPSQLPALRQSVSSTPPSAPRPSVSEESPATPSTATTATTTTAAAVAAPKVASPASTGSQQQLCLCCQQYRPVHFCMDCLNDRLLRHQTVEALATSARDDIVEHISTNLNEAGLLHQHNLTASLMNTNLRIQRVQLRLQSIEDRLRNTIAFTDDFRNQIGARREALFAAGESQQKLIDKETAKRVSQLSEKLTSVDEMKRKVDDYGGVLIAEMIKIFDFRVQQQQQQQQLPSKKALDVLHPPKSSIGGLRWPRGADWYRYPSDHINACVGHAMHAFLSLSRYLDFALPFTIVNRGALSAVYPTIRAQSTSSATASTASAPPPPPAGKSAKSGIRGIPASISIRRPSTPTSSSTSSKNDTAIPLSQVTFPLYLTDDNHASFVIGLSMFFYNLSAMYTHITKRIISNASQTSWAVILLDECCRHITEHGRLSRSQSSTASSTTNGTTRTSQRLLNTASSLILSKGNNSTTQCTFYDVVKATVALYPDIDKQATPLAVRVDNVLRGKRLCDDELVDPAAMIAADPDFVMDEWAVIDADADDHDNEF